ncbi:MAG: hypothetical protein GXO30_01085 [Epsilonproteobacteria bacterium]|nr:hypothetical protein [Campylobacterota bacterium]
MQKSLLLLLVATALFGEISETLHSSISTYYENKDYTNSKQKQEGVAYGVGIDFHHKNSAYKITYEEAKADTKKPPLKEDLKNKKLFLKYNYKLNDKIAFNLNYIKVFSDNIAITSGGKTYGAGCSYIPNKRTTLNFTQFYTNYKDFNVNQSDFRIDFKTKFNHLKLKISSITKYISLRDDKPNSFTKNTKKEYFTTGLKLHAHYKSYHIGGGFFIGKRAFSVMNEGSKLQHHAMEFDRTYALGIGKSISKFVFRVQYIYQRATELPPKNKNVEVKVIRVILNYKF